LSAHPEGLTNAQIAHELGLASDYQGHHQGYLSWSVMGLLLNSKKVEKQGRRSCLRGTDRSSRQALIER
jgi:hypothetical protein